MAFGLNAGKMCLAMCCCVHEPIAHYLSFSIFKQKEKYKMKRIEVEKEPKKITIKQRT